MILHRRVFDTQLDRIYQIWQIQIELKLLVYTSISYLLRQMYDSKGQYFKMVLVCTSFNLKISQNLRFISDNRLSQFCKKKFYSHLWNVCLDFDVNISLFGWREIYNLSLITLDLNQRLTFLKKKKISQQSILHKEMYDFVRFLKSLK